MNRCVSVRARSRISLPANTSLLKHHFLRAEHEIQGVLVRLGHSVRGFAPPILRRSRHPVRKIPA